jgi:threonine dehydrogenase-like Zn-dependent dehydrogenase
MKAIVAEPPKNNSVKLVDLIKPKPKKNQVLLKILRVGIDGTDREINEGIYGTPPKGHKYLVLGHESLGRIQELGEGVKNFSIGELVVPTVRRPCDEQCLNCEIGETDMCLTGNYYEHGIYRLHGFASEYALSEANYLIKIPEELANVAILLEPLSIAEKAIIQTLKIQERLDWKPKNVLINGAGPLGLLTAIILALRRFRVYVAATRKTESLKGKIVQSIGGSYINVKETPINSLDIDFDLIIEATGRVDVALKNFALLNRNSIMCILGIYHEQKACQEFGKFLTNMTLGNRLVFGSVSSNKNHFKMGIKDMYRTNQQYGPLLQKLITQSLELEEFAQSFKPERENIKTIINFN